MFSYYKREYILILENLMDIYINQNLTSWSQPLSSFSDSFPFSPINLGLCCPMWQPLAACNLASLGPILSLCSLAKASRCYLNSLFLLTSLGNPPLGRNCGSFRTNFICSSFLRDHSHTLPLVHCLTTVCPCSGCLQGRLSP